MGSLIRLGLAAVWLVSGALKAVDPAQTRIAVRAYEMLPPGVAGPVATALPLVELMLGALFLMGAGTRWAALVSIVLLAAFLLGAAQAWMRGLSIDCGCFGGGGAVAEGSAAYPQELARDTALLLLGLWLLVRPGTALSIDGWQRAGGSLSHKAGHRGSRPAGRCG